MLNWINKNKFLSVFLLVAAFVGWNFFISIFGTDIAEFNFDSSPQVSKMSAPSSFGSNLGGVAENYYDSTSSTANRVVIQNSNMSLLVKDVRSAGDMIIGHAQEKGGYMVSASYNRPDESAYGVVSVRVPSATLEESLEFFRGLSVKVTNEAIEGQDVTEQYVDIEERLATLARVKSKYEEILDNAVSVDSILRVQKEIINTQSQIDALVGQREAIEQNASLTKVTLHLSTDELSLPYTPDNKFRPGVIFKNAVRSMLGSLQNIGGALIWLFVYSVIWAPVAIFVIWLRGRRKNKKQL